MNTELLRKVLDIVEGEVRSRPSAMEFEMAYQVRVAIERIRSAVKLAEQSARMCPDVKQAGLDLLDALDRLESADRSFQRRFRATSAGQRECQTEAASGKSPEPCLSRTSPQ